MRLKTMVHLILLLFLCNLPVMAQKITFERGESEELRGVEKIYIDTANDLTSYKRIAKKIRKELPDLIITSKPEEAGARLVFITQQQIFVSRSYLTGTTYANRGTCAEHTIIQSSHIPTYIVDTHITGLVIKCTGGDRLRILMEFKGSRFTIFKRHPSTNFAGAFVKAYKKANKQDFKSKPKQLQPY